MKKGILLWVAAFFFFLILMPHESQAVPSFARQLQKPCTACHTIWPNLNQYGRQFKVKAYTDVSPEWQMINKDKLNLLYIFPVSARVVFYPYTKEQDQVAGINSNSTQLNTVDLFVGSRVFDYAGVFGNIEATNVTSSALAFDIPTIKAAFQYPLGGAASTTPDVVSGQGSTIGIVAFKGLATSADPFNSLGGRDRGLIFDAESVPWILSKGWTFDFWSGGNLGVVVHGYFLGNRLYAAVGAERGGNSSDTSFGFSSSSINNNNNSNPFAGYFRLAWDQKLPNGAVTFGGTWYTGKQRLIDETGAVTGTSGTPLFESSVNRGYLDVSLEQNFGEDHLVEAQALYGYGKETNVFGGFSGGDETRKFDGFLVEGSYFYDRMIGIVGSYNRINIKGVLPTDLASATGSTLPTVFGLNSAGSPNVAGVDENKKNTWVVALNYLPWLNTKAALQYAQTKTKFVGGQPDETDKVFRVIFDILF